MIIVMMDGNTRDLIREWTEEGIPFVEKTFRVKKGRENRALAGLSMGDKEDIGYENCKAMRERFDAFGLKYTYYKHPSGHTWPVWRESIYQFAQILFK